MNDLTSSRDMELVRQILLEIEKRPPWSGWIDLKLPGYSNEVISYHVMLLNEAGLITAVSLTTSTGSAFEDWRPIRLTWQGYEFLEAVRDDKRWEKVKAEMSKGGGFVYEIAKSIALDFFEEEINPNRVQSLKSQLIRRYNNLNELEEQAANYGAAAVSLELKNLIQAEKEAIAELEEKLRLLTG